MGCTLTVAARTSSRAAIVRAGRSGVCTPSCIPAVPDSLPATGQRLQRPSAAGSSPERHGGSGKSTGSFWQVDRVVPASRPGRSGKSTGSFRQVDRVVLASRPGRSGKSTWSFRQVDLVVKESRPGRSGNATWSFWQSDLVVLASRPGRFGKSTGSVRQQYRAVLAAPPWEGRTVGLAARRSDVVAAAAHRKRMGANSVVQVVGSADHYTLLTCASSLVVARAAGVAIVMVPWSDPWCGNTGPRVPGYSSRGGRRSGGRCSGCGRDRGWLLGRQRGGRCFCRGRSAGYILSSGVSPACCRCRLSDLTGCRRSRIAQWGLIQ